ncbi:MAG: class II aldolase/adducin family protein [Rubrivivax sp.]|nr:class II aldolase/adducin family protein [Rubrivivax sp.]
MTSRLAEAPAPAAAVPAPFPAPAEAAALVVPRHSCTGAEWAARQQLAACYRVFHLLGWTELIYNHISLRVPDSPGHLLLNRFGLHYTEVKASNLVKVDLQGRVVAPAGAAVNAAGVAPHCAIHAGVPDAHCVMHTHTTAGMAVACSRAGLAFDNFYAAQLWGRVAYHDFEGITVRADEGPRLVADIGDGRDGRAPKPAVILRNHGLLAWGTSLPAAFYTLWALQRACEVQLAGTPLGATVPISEAIRLACQEDAKKVNAEPEFGRDTFDALVRLVDRADGAWRE